MGNWSKVEAVGRPCNAFGDGRTHFAGKDELLLVLYE